MNTKDNYTDFEIAGTEEPAYSETGLFPFLKYLLAGTLFGIILTKSEVISWYRIQEMFRLESFHMYGVIGSAVVTGIVSVWLIKKLRLKTIDGKPIHIAPKSFHKGQVIGGCLFGFGWAMTGACPGPLFAILGTGVTVILVSIAFAVLGTWFYGKIQHRLPH